MLNESVFRSGWLIFTEFFIEKFKIIRWEGKKEVRKEGELNEQEKGGTEKRRVKEGEAKEASRETGNGGEGRGGIDAKGGKGSESGGGELKSKRGEVGGA